MLAYASLAYATLAYETLAYATLPYASLAYASLAYATLPYASLAYASLAYASLAYTTLAYLHIQEIFPWLITICQPVLSQCGRKMAHSPPPMAPHNLWTSKSKAEVQSWTETLDGKKCRQMYTLYSLQSYITVSCKTERMVLGNIKTESIITVWLLYIGKL